MKKQYIMPQVEVVRLHATDIIATSFQDLGLEFETGTDTDFMESRTSSDWSLWDE